MKHPYKADEITIMPHLPSSGKLPTATTNRSAIEKMPARHHTNHRKTSETISQTGRPPKAGWPARFPQNIFPTAGRKPGLSFSSFFSIDNSLPASAGQHITP